MTPRENLLSALRRDHPTWVPMAISFATAKYQEFVQRTGQQDYYAYYQLPYRHVPQTPAATFPDFSRYFAGRVPDWPSGESPIVPLASFVAMGPHQTMMNEWGEYRIYDNRGDYHQKVNPLPNEECSVEDILTYPFPDFRASARYASIGQDITAIQTQGLAAILGCEMTIFEKAWRIRGMENLMVDMAFNPEVVDCLVEQISARTGFFAAQYAALGVDIVQLGDDVGTQHGMMLSPTDWRRFFKPAMARVVAGIKNSNPKTLVFYHSDGNISEVIADLLEIGIDILNPVQAECMDIAALKRDYGQHLSFWGGMGVQTTLPFGSPSDVRTAVRQLLIDTAAGGGLVVAPGHVLEHDVPWENIEAFVTAVQEFCTY